MKWLIAVALCVVAGYAGAATVIHLNWSIPATRVDGTPLVVTELTNYTLFYACDTGRTGTRTVTPPTLTNIALLGDWLGNCSFAMSATDTAGHTGPLSALVKILIKLDKPTAGGIR
jgi:hypothetical protein